MKKNKKINWIKWNQRMKFLFMKNEFNQMKEIKYLNIKYDN